MHKPWVAVGVDDDPPRANQEIVAKFRQLVDLWMGHTEFLVNHDALPACLPSEYTSASQWAMSWLMDYWNRYIAHLTRPEQSFGPLDIYEDDRVIDCVDHAQVNYDEFNRPDWGKFQAEARKFMAYPWFNPYDLTDGAPGAMPKSAGAPAASRAASSSWSSSTAIGAVIVATHPRGTGTISTGMEWGGTDESFIPRLLVALETTLPELFLVMVTVMVLSVVTAWCYGRGYLKFSLEVGNSRKAKNKMTDKGMQTEPAKLALQSGNHQGKGGGKSKQGSAAGSNRSASQSARSSRTPSVRSASVPRSPGSPPTTPPTMRQIRETHDRTMRQIQENHNRSRNQARPIERINERPARRPRAMTEDELTLPHLRPSAPDPWYYAPLSGSCYHLEQSCAGLRNARDVRSEESTFGKSRLLCVNNLRPCRLCASEDRRRHRQQ